MSEEVKVPEVGESITEGLIAEWNKKDGDYVQMDDQLFELETDKVTMPVNSAFEGRLHIKVKEGETVKIGDVVAEIDTDASEKAEEKSKEKAPDKEGKKKEEKPAEKPRKEEKETGKKQKEKAGAEEIAPSARRIIEEHDLDASTIEGSGKKGRITKGDVLRVLEEKKITRIAPEDEEREAEARPARIREWEREEAEAKAGSARREGDRSQTRTPMSPLRQRLAQRLVEAQQNAALVTTYNEADMTRVLRIREGHKDNFEMKYGVRLGFMGFFIKAAVDALKTIPAVNAWIDGTDIVQNHFYDIGIAVSTDKGLVVPILRDCDVKSLPEIELEVSFYAQRARERKLTLDDLEGGSFSISNGGVFGSLLSAPMLNPPQSAILGMHVIKQRPVVVDNRIEIRPMMYLALTYDHRLVDGREGVTFLKRIVECIENPERMLLEV
jgi:2-oxoglutarate dehydrogenase E2 component (dihydrolipoamide succinyltransferase)